MLVSENASPLLRECERPIVSGREGRAAAISRSGLESDPRLGPALLSAGVTPAPLAGYLAWPAVFLLGFYDCHKNR